MSASPFAFYRGAAKIMATDLATTPAAGLTAQICGDAHLANFGTYAAPDRGQVFDLNDFDETLPGPWEWDVKRLATSFVVAGRDNDFDDAQIRPVAMTSVTAYREAVAEFAEAKTMDVWYARLSVDEILSGLTSKAHRKRVAKQANKARSKDSLKAHSKLTEKVGGTHRIKSDRPLLLPFRELPSAAKVEDLRTIVESSLKSYAATLNDDRKHLLGRYRFVDIAMKVVGVGSVGTRCMIVLFEGRDQDDPLFLQVKQANRSVLEDHLSPSKYADHGQRVVEGQRLMQAASDIFLGWTTEAKTQHHYYWRQLHDMKGSADISAMDATEMAHYAKLCGWTLARAHAGSGDPIAIAGYLGSSDVYDQAVADFATRYADQNERDYEAFVKAIEDGRLEAAELE